MEQATRQDFINWARTRPADEEYNPVQFWNCAITEFALSRGMITRVGTRIRSADGSADVYIDLDGSMVMRGHRLSLSARAVIGVSSIFKDTFPLTNVLCPEPDATFPLHTYGQLVQRLEALG